jgi:uncharacterized membrane protein
VFTKARHRSLSWARCIQFTHSHLFPSDSFSFYLHIYAQVSRVVSPPSGFLTKILYAFRIFPIRATCPASLILLDLITLVVFGEAYKLRRSSLCSLLQFPGTFSLLDLTVNIDTSCQKCNSMGSNKVRRLGGPQSRSGRGGEEKNSQPLPALEPPLIQSVAHRYTTELSRLRMDKLTCQNLFLLNTCMSRLENAVGFTSTPATPVRLFNLICWLYHEFWLP